MAAFLPQVSMLFYMAQKTWQVHNNILTGIKLSHMIEM